MLHHGIRNSRWWRYKNASTGWLMRSLPWFITLHIAIYLRHLRRRNGKVLWRLYRDAWRGLPALAAKRRRIAKSRRTSLQTFRQWIEPKFYERDYVRRALKEL